MVRGTSRLPRARQKEAVRFLQENAFATPTHFLRDDILRYIEVEGALRRINQQQSSVLGQLFNDRRMERLVEFEALPATRRDAYPLAEMLADVRTGIWSELSEGSVRVDAFRRELQRSYLTQVNGKVNPAPFVLPAGLPPEFLAQLGPARATSDVKALFKEELRTLDADVARAIGRQVIARPALTWPMFATRSRRSWIRSRTERKQEAGKERSG